jgi:hypothetical protein
MEDIAGSVFTYKDVVTYVPDFRNHTSRLRTGSVDTCVVVKKSGKKFPPTRFQNVPNCSQVSIKR